MMISYAQNFEDVMLERVFRDHELGFYIDVGAGEPVLDSVTKHFYDKGWCGINVEPVASHFEKLTIERTRDTNLRVALSNETAVRDFHVFSDALNLSTLKADQAEKHQRTGYHRVVQQVHVTTLKAICERHVHGPIDFLKIDVEGAESEVLAGADWTSYRPRVVVVESVEPLRGNPLPEGWDRDLVTGGYFLVYTDGLNQFYVREEDSRLKRHFLLPPNVFDQFHLYATNKAMEQRDQALAMLAAIHGSMSWRCTAPLRHFKKWLRFAAGRPKDSR